MMALPIGSMYAIYGDIYHQYTPNVSIYTIHGSYGIIRNILQDFYVGTLRREDFTPAEKPIKRPCRTAESGTKAVMLRWP